MSSPKKYSRRKFMGQSATVAAGTFAAPWFVTSNVLSAASKSGKLSKPGANDRIAIGYIGAGRRANQLMNLPPEAHIVAISDVYLPRAQKVANRHGAKAYQDYREMLDSKEIDAVVVATPDHWHTLPSIHACQAGKDVYCEKPLTLTIREGRQLVNAARKYNRVVQTGSQQRTMAANRFACQLVRDGRLGKLLEVIGHNYPSPWKGDLSAQSPLSGIDWNTWCGQTELRPFNGDIFTPRANPGWVSFRDFSGGEMTGWGAHGLDQVQMALGTDDTGPVEVWTAGGKFQPPTYSSPESRERGDKLCSSPEVHFRYANGVTLRLADGPPGGAVFVCERGKITIDRGKFKIESEELSRELLKGVELERDTGNHHLQDWVECMKSRKNPSADVEIGHRSATLCHLGNIGRWTGRKLRWDPVKEIFQGDHEATAMVAREQRKPFQIPDQV